jgi:3-deoxy-manno-octulosonate cytidylyltransferase (CMP-KDO synthetase)
MTKDTHTDCLDRCTEAANILHEQGIHGDRYIVIQGDEPMFKIETLDVEYENENINFYTKITVDEEIEDPNVPKVVINKDGDALYFSRYGIPFHGEKTRRNRGELLTFYKQIGIYAMSLRLLNKYSSMSSTYLENTEGIGLNRFLENGIPVHMVYTDHDSVSVDTEEDRQRVEKLIYQRANRDD